MIIFYKTIIAPRLIRKNSRAAKTRRFVKTLWVGMSPPPNPAMRDKAWQAGGGNKNGPVESAQELQRKGGLPVEPDRFFYCGIKPDVL